MQDLIQLPRVVTDPEFKYRLGGPCAWSDLDPQLGEQANGSATVRGQDLSTCADGKRRRGQGMAARAGPTGCMNCG
jgi:hypothetical protein